MICRFYKACVALSGEPYDALLINMVRLVMIPINLEHFLTRLAFMYIAVRLL
jgi:hypothetical protein